MMAEEGVEGVGVEEEDEATVETRRAKAEVMVAGVMARGEVRTSEAGEVVESRESCKNEEERQEGQLAARRREEERRGRSSSSEPVRKA